MFRNEYGRGMWHNEIFPQIKLLLAVINVDKMKKELGEA